MRSVSRVRSVLALVAVVLGAGWGATPSGAQTMEGLGFLPGATYPRSLASGVSADGSSVVGTAGNDQGSDEAFIWTGATGMVGLGYLPGTPYSEASGVSADG